MTLLERRKALGLSAAAVGEKVGVSQVTIWHYEKGTFQPKHYVAQKLANLYGCTIDEIYDQKKGE